MGHKDLVNILGQFKVPSGKVHIQPITSGRINMTCFVTIIANRGESVNRYVLQKINRNVFAEPEIILRNLEALSNYQKSPGFSLIQTHSDTGGYIDDRGNCFRLMEYVENQEPDRTLRTSIFEAGVAVAKFHSMYWHFAVEELQPVIKDFHHTPKRHLQYLKVLKIAFPERLHTASGEINFVAQNNNLAAEITRRLEKGVIPLRVTHNDTKIENILFDENGKSICLIDFDTVMPGAVAWDFGDSIRSMANSVNEEEEDIEKVQFVFDHFVAFASGYASVMDGEISKEETLSLVPGCLCITFEQGLRFLADYLNNDQYYPVIYENQNLVRARVQFKLLQQMISQKEKMETAVSQLFPFSLAKSS